MQPQPYAQLLRPVGATLCSQARCSERVTGKWRYCAAHLPPVLREKPVVKRKPKPTKRRPRVRLATSEQRIIEQLERCGGAAHNLMLLRATGASVNSASTAINNLVARGILAKVRRGVYCFADKVEWGSTYRYPRQRETDERVLAALPVGRKVKRASVYRIAGSVHSGRLSLDRLQRLGRVERVSTQNVRRLS